MEMKAERPEMISVRDSRIFCCDCEIDVYKRQLQPRAEDLKLRSRPGAFVINTLVHRG